MPELPEVEVTRRGLADRLLGARILRAHVDGGLRWPLGVAPAMLEGRRVRALGRRGKYLLLALDGGTLLIHLGMSGSLALGDALPPAGVHDHARFLTTRGELRLHDPRRFGAVIWSTDLHAGLAYKLLDGLGAEPLDDSFTAESFYAALQVHRAAIKTVLLSGKVVVGVGNIYASESLYAAGIRPTVRASRLSRPRVGRLRVAIRDTLAAAIEQGGSTLRDFCGATGEAGHFLHEAAVYGRAGLACKVCGNTIRQIRQGQRSTYFCPTCQRF